MLMKETSITLRMKKKLKKMMVKKKMMMKKTNMMMKHNIIMMVNIMMIVTMFECHLCNHVSFE